MTGAIRTTLLFVFAQFCFPAFSNAFQPEKNVIKENVTIADIALVIDQSGSIQDHYKEELDFAKKFVNSFPIGLNETRFALVQFSFANMTNVRLAWKDGSSKERIVSTLDSMQNDPLGAGTDFAMALRVVYEQVCKPEYGDRPDVPNVMVLVTDGYFNNPWEMKQAVEIASKLRESGVLLYAIQVKTDPSLPAGEGPVQNLARLTANRSRVFDVENFEKLTNDLLSRITHQITVEYENCLYEYIPTGSCYRTPTNGRCTVDAELKINRLPSPPHGQPCPTTNRTQRACDELNGCAGIQINESVIDPLPGHAEKAIRADDSSESKAALPFWAIVVIAVVGGMILLIIMIGVVIARTPRWKAIFTPSKPGTPQLPGNMDETISSSSTSSV